MVGTMDVAVLVGHGQLALADVPDRVQVALLDGEAALCTVSK